MNRNAAIGVLVLFVVVVVGAVLLVAQSKNTPTDSVGDVQTSPAAAGTTKPVPTPVPVPTPSAQSSDTTRVMSIENYIATHIHDFSPVKEQLGGTFHVTKVTAHGGAGTVYYEDGHSAYVADFTYSVDDFGAVSIDSFKVRS
jgi:hypothetical protein